MAHTADDMDSDEPSPGALKIGGFKHEELGSAPKVPPATLVSKEAIQTATEGALAFWRSCRRHDLDDEAKVKGALVKYQMSIDAAPAVERLRAEAFQNQSAHMQESLWHWREEIGKLRSKIARLEAEKKELHRAIMGGEPDPSVTHGQILEMIRTLTSTFAAALAPGGGND